MLVVRDNGRAWGWGLNGRPWAEEPELVRFLGSAKNPKPEPRFLENVAAVAVGDQFSYLLCADGVLWALSRNDDDRMGVPMGDKGSPMVSPMKVMDNVAQVAVSGTKTAVVKRDGALWSWDSKIPPAKLLDNVQRVAVCFGHGLALMRGGSLMAWGDNTQGQLGDGSRENRPAPVPVTIPGLGDSPVVALAVIDGFSTAVTADGKLHQWGRSPEVKDPRQFPEQVPKLPAENVRSVSFGLKALTLKTDGTLWISGGDTAPEQVLDNVAEASASKYGTFLALKNDGSFWVWGNSQYSALGVNSGEPRPKPGRLRFIDEPEPLSIDEPGPLSPALQKLIAAKAALPPAPSLERPIEIQGEGSVGEKIVLLLHKGRLWESSSYADSRNFARVSLKKNPEKMIYDTRDISPYHSLFFKDGILMAKGENKQGQLGDGTAFDRDAPVPVRMPEGVTADSARVSVIATGYEQSGLVMDGVIWLWGRRGLCEGNDSPRAISTPRPLTFAAGEVVDIALGAASIVILTKDGTLWTTKPAFSHKSDESIGKSSAWKDTPYKILTNVRSFASDGSYHVALKKDGSLWGWGRNYENQLSADREQEFDKPTRLNWKFEK